MVDTSSCLQGNLLALGMFVCPGPKDILILRQALHRRPAAELIAIGVLSDALLITLGVCGLSAMLAGMPSLLVIGTAGAVQAPANQASFSAGAVLASATWFIALVFGGRHAGSFASSSATWRTVDALVAVTMLGLALFLATTLA